LHVIIVCLKMKKPVFCLYLLAILFCSIQSVFGFRSLAQFGFRFPSITSLGVVHKIQSAQEFEATINSTSPCVIEFQKSKCKPCIQAAPQYEKLAEKFGHIVNFYKVDADSWSEAISLMKENGVKSVPTFQIWNNGEKLQSMRGVDELDTLATMLSEPAYLQ